MNPQTAEEGTEITLAANTFTREGWTFSGWATSADGNIVHKDGGKIKLTENLTLYAQWTEIGKVEKVTFSATGDVDYNEKITLSCGTDGATIYYLLVTGADAPTDEEFSSSKKEYSGPITITENSVVAAAAVKDGMKDSETATATFTVKTYTVTFETAHGTVPTKIEGLRKGGKLTEEQLKEPENVTGYRFDGWFDGETQFTAETEITSDITLTAKWTKTYTVTFDANGGSGAIASITEVAGTEIELPENIFAKDGCIFTGWATSAGVGVSYSDKAKITVTGDITLYATWGMTAANAAAAIASLTEEGTHTVTVAGEITTDDLTKLTNAISGLAENVKVILDLGGTTGLTDIPAEFDLKNLAGIAIPASVTKLSCLFWNSFNLSVLKVAENNPAYKSVGNIIYTKDGQTLVLAAKNLTEVTIPSGIKTIGSWAFRGSSDLKKVSFEEASVLETIEESAFDSCSELTEITLPSTLRTLGEQVFDSCSELKSITLPEGIKTIPTCTFLNCKSLTEISLPSTLEFIGNMAFYNMGLSTVKYNGTKSGWGNIQRGNNNNDLDNAAVICMGSEPKEVYAPADKAAAAIATLEGGTRTNPNVCTVKITSKELTDENILKEISKKIDSVFANPSYIHINLDLSTVEITEISENTFASVKLTEITLPNSLKTIGKNAFGATYHLKKIVIPDNVETIKTDAFIESWLTEITLPASLSSIEEGAFFECDKLETVYYKGTQAQWAQIKIDDYNDKLTGAKIICADGGVINGE